VFDEPIRSERQPLVASLASGLKRFYARSIWPAAKDFENIKCVMNSPVREFLEANTPEAGRRVNLERRGQQGEQEIDALPGDPQSSPLDSRARSRTGGPIEVPGDGLCMAALGCMEMFECHGLSTDSSRPWTGYG